MVQINTLLGNKELVNIIGFFIDHPSGEFSQTEVIRDTGISKTTVIKWIDRLEKIHLIRMRKIGTSNIYKLNRESSIVKQIKILNTLLSIEPLKKIDAEVYLYGSAARGEDVEDSDIDILIIGKMNRRDVIGEIDKLSKDISKNISFKIFEDLEWSQIARKDRSFYERVEKDKIRII